MSRRLRHPAWIPLAALALVWALSYTPLYQRLEVLALDVQSRLVAREHYFQDALVIDIDDRSLQELQPYFGGWPYKRDVYAMLIDYLSEMGARTVAFDVVFADPREGDARLRASISRMPHVVLAATANSEAWGSDPSVPANLAWTVPNGLPARVWPGVQLPLSRFIETPSGAHVGVVSVVADQDGVLRRIPLFHRFNGQYLPSMPLIAQLDGGPQPRVQSLDGNTQVGDYVWPTDAEGAIHLYFPRNRNSVLSMPFARVGVAMLGLPGQALDPAVFRGKTIFIGSTALFTDRVLTPVGDINGVYILAIAHQSLAHHLIMTPRQWKWTGLLLLIALVPALLLFLRPRRSAYVGTMLSAGAALVIYAIHLGLLHWLKQESPLLLPLLVVLFANILEALRAVRLRNEAQKTEIHILANDDPLTQLPNRFSLQAQLDLAIEHARTTHGPLAVLLVGLSDFRTINNALGHEMGDRVLSEAANRLRASVQSCDIVARLGSDEFVVVSRADEAAAIDYAHTILQAFSQPYHLIGQELHVSANVGVSLYPTDGEDVATLLKQANGAMRDARTQGRNTTRLFTPDLSQAAMERLLIENQLHDALARDELVLVYQPQINMQTQRMVAVEALVRWNHPTRGLLGPDQFIPTAEHTELILPLGEWVLRTACQQMRAWQLAGLTHIGRMAVNLSARQFEQSTLPELIARVLRETRLDAAHLELEITESVAMRNPEHTIDILKRLRDMGVTLALDDFGTGYSSLSYFKLFPVTSLKIDQSFVRNIETDRYDAEICEATINMARKLGLAVVAEGVETPGQFHFLRKLGCSDAQGYLFSRPLLAADLAQFQPPSILD